MSLRRACARLALLACWAVTLPAAATPAALTGVGPRTQALAGSGSALDLGYEAASQNPAALTRAQRPELSAGYGIVSTWLYVEREGSREQRLDSAPFGTTTLGFALPLWLGEMPLVLGFASASPGGSVARADLPLPEQPQFPLLVGRQRAVDFDVSLGVRPFRSLSLGAGLRGLASLSGNVEVTRDDDDRTTASVDDSVEPVLAPLFGGTFELGPNTLALVLRTPLRADFAVELAAIDLGATQLPAMHLAGVAHYDPLAIHFEYARRFERLTAMAGIAYQRFSDAPALLARTVTCPSERPDCAALDIEEPGLEDTFDLHAALAYDVPVAAARQLQLRAGYAFLPSPAPEQTGSANLLDATRHRLALGSGLKVAGDGLTWSLDFAAALEKLNERTHHKSAPGAGSLRTRGHVVSLALGLTVKL